MVIPAGGGAGAFMAIAKLARRAAFQGTVARLDADPEPIDARRHERLRRRGCGRDGALCARPSATAPAGGGGGGPGGPTAS
jgi:hypothetical protein